MGRRICRQLARDSAPQAGRAEEPRRRLDVIRSPEPGTARARWRA